MTEIRQIYKCDICGNIVEVLHNGVGELVCCGEPMNLLTEKTKDAGLEKHVPVTDEVGNRIKVRVGDVPHPMEPNHYIEWIELLADGTSYKKFLKPGDAPEAEFEISAESLVVREFCNLHGLWKSG